MFKVFSKIIYDIITGIFEIFIDYPVYHQDLGQCKTKHTGYFNFIFDIYYYWFPKKTTETFEEAVRNMKIIDLSKLDPHSVIMSTAQID